MQIVFLVLIAFCPLYIFAVCLVRQKCPLYPLVMLTISAAAGVFVCGVIESWLAVLLLGVVQTSIAGSFLGWWTAAITEESIKLLVFYAIAGYCGIFCIAPCYPSEQQPMLLPESAEKVYSHSSVLYALFFGFAFGGFETLSYTIRYTGSLPYRMLSATVLHGTLPAFYCACLQSTAEFRRSAAAVRPYWIGIPILLHGLYNMFSGFGGVFTVFAYSIVLFSCLNAYNACKNRRRRINCRVNRRGEL